MSEQNLQNHKTNRTLTNLSVAFHIVVRDSLFEPKEGVGQPCIPSCYGVQNRLGRDVTRDLEGRRRGPVRVMKSDLFFRPTSVSATNRAGRQCEQLDVLADGIILFRGSHEDMGRVCHVLVVLMVLNTCSLYAQTELTPPGKTPHKRRWIAICSRLPFPSWNSCTAGINTPLHKSFAGTWRALRSCKTTKSTDSHNSMCCILHRCERFVARRKGRAAASRVDPAGRRLEPSRTRRYGRPGG